MFVCVEWLHYTVISTKPVRNPYKIKMLHQVTGHITFIILTYFVTLICLFHYSFIISPYWDFILVFFFCCCFTPLIFCCCNASISSGRSWKFHLISSHFPLFFFPSKYLLLSSALRRAEKQYSAASEPTPAVLSDHQWCRVSAWQSEGFGWKIRWASGENAFTTKQNIGLQHIDRFKKQFQKIYIYVF